MVTTASDSTPRTERMPPRSFVRKLGSALRGAKLGIRAESNFFVHLFAAAAVVAAAIVLRVSLIEWCLLALSIVGVLAAEMFNSAIEQLARAITSEHDVRIGRALDISSAAVLLASMGAVIVGTIVFTHRIGSMLGWWT